MHDVETYEPGKCAWLRHGFLAFQSLSQQQIGNQCDEDLNAHGVLGGSQKVAEKNLWRRLPLLRKKMPKISVLCRLPLRHQGRADPRFIQRCAQTVGVAVRHQFFAKQGVVHAFKLRGVLPKHIAERGSDIGARQHQAAELGNP
jgi:hypothetical protein